MQWALARTRVMQRGHARFGDVFALDVLGGAALGPAGGHAQGAWVFLAHPRLVKQVFTADPGDVLAGETNRFLEALVGPRSILVLDPPEHMPERRLMLPPLHGDRVRGYGELMHDVAAAEVERWPRGEAFELWPRMQAITLEVIARAVFGITDPRRLEHVQERLRIMLNRMTSKRWLAVQGLRAAATRALGRDGELSRSASALIRPVDEVLYDEIRLRRSAADLDSREDILSTLVRARYPDGTGMRDEALRDELMTLLIAGHESTATSLAWAFERLLRHPAKLERLRAEAQAGGDEYADAVVKETMRLRPVIPFVLRKLARPMELGGYELAAGTWVAPCGYLVHRREDVYPEPDRFRPERFLERPAGTYTWIPFGGGVRRCLGAAFAQLEMRRVLQAVATRAELLPAAAGPERVKTRFVTLAPARGARVVMAR